MASPTRPESNLATLAQVEQVDQFLADRAEWVAAGRPADMTFRHWRGVISAKADRFAEELGYVRPEAVEPLVTLR